MRPDISLKSLVFFFFFVVFFFWGGGFFGNRTCGREGRAEEETLVFFSEGSRMPLNCFKRFFIKHMK